jgi:hypothetical protein
MPSKHPQRTRGNFEKTAISLLDNMKAATTRNNYTYALLATDHDALPLDEFKSRLQEASEKSQLSPPWLSFWYNHGADRRALIQSALFAQAKESVLLYVPTLSDSLQPDLAVCIDKGVSLTILCDQAPDPQSAVFTMTKNHMDKTKSGHIDIVPPFAQKFATVAFLNDDKPHHLLCVDHSHFMITSEATNDPTYVSFGYTETNSAADGIVNFFDSFAKNGELTAGQRPRPPRKKNFWGSLYS